MVPARALSGAAPPAGCPTATAPPVVFLMGPTACGKTDLAAHLADSRAAELISVDAAQIYRGMDIGTAKPAAAFLRRHPHHLIDIRDPHEYYSAAQFRSDALALIADIHGRGRLPVLVGGSMFYFAALEHGLSPLPATNAATRREITAQMEQHGSHAMHAALHRIDPGRAAALSPADSQRVRRALEIHRLSAAPPSEVMARGARTPLPWPLIKFGLFIAERRRLHQRIRARFLEMLQRGLVEEVAAVVAAVKGCENAANLPAMRTVGYRQVAAHLDRRLSRAQMTEQAVAATRQLAKRQLTWLRRQGNVVWVEADHAMGAVQGYLDAY